MKAKILFIIAILLCGVGSAAAADPADVALFLILGQSNADGSAFSDPAEDKAMREWYTTAPEARLLNIWYAPTQVRNEPNALGQSARHVIDGLYRDMEPQWMRLWYRNDNVARRTAMNMIHGAGTYSAMAQGRRGIEGELGRRFAADYPGMPLYVIKLGVSGSGIDTWANPADDHNWRYFTDRVYRPAVDSLVASGKRPHLVGVWWMQGCADSGSTAEAYGRSLRELVDRLRSQLGFPSARVYVGLIPAPGEGDATPEGSLGYSDAVRSAQRAVAADTPGVTLVPTADCSMQYEDNFHGKIHFDHPGINRVADNLMDAVRRAGTDAWCPYNP